MGRKEGIRWEMGGVVGGGHLGHRLGLRDDFVHAAQDLLALARVRARVLDPDRRAPLVAFGAWGLGFGVWGVGCGVWGLRFGVWG